MMDENKMTNISPEEKAQVQLERLQSTLNRVVRNVPFHRKRLTGEAAVENIETLGDIPRLPFMERTHLGDHYPYGLFAVPLRDIVRIHTAPGTTLHPTISGYTKQDLTVWQRMVAASLGGAGVTDHDILLIHLDPGLANWARDYKDGAEEIGAGVIPNTPLSIEKKLLVLLDYRATVLITTPASARRLADHMYETGKNPTTLNLKNIILVGEYAPMENRRYLEEKLHVTTWQHYGLSELPGPAMGFECAERGGLHMNEEDLIVEIIDPQTGEVLPEGETGELILTTISTRAFPLIRFRTGDRARIIEGPCPCGNAHSRIEWYPERVDGLMNICGVKVHDRQIAIQLEKALGTAPESYRCFKNSHRAKDFLEVWVTVTDRFFSDEIKELQRIMVVTEERLTENLGIPVTVRLKENR